MNLYDVQCEPVVPFGRDEMRTMGPRELHVARLVSTLTASVETHDEEHRGALLGAIAP